MAIFSLLWKKWRAGNVLTKGRDVSKRSPQADHPDSLNNNIELKVLSQKS